MKPKINKKSFKRFLQDVNRASVKHGFYNGANLVNVTGEDAWRGYWEDDFTGEEALIADMKEGL